MKRAELIRRIKRQGCRVLRNGANHDIFINDTGGEQAPIPRHREIPESLCKLICKQLHVKFEKE